MISHAPVHCWIREKAGEGEWVDMGLLPDHPEEYPYDEDLAWPRIATTGDHHNDYVILTATMNNDCGSNTRQIYLKSSFLGIDDSDNLSISLHPNPTNGMLTITGDKLHQAEITNLLGQQMLRVEGKGDDLHVDMTALPTGIYFVTVTDEEGCKCVRKVIKK